MRAARRRHWSTAVLVMAVCGLMLVAGGSASSVATAGATGRAVMCLGLAATRVGIAAAETINGTEGADVIVGLGGNDIINGLGGNDRICGSGGNDRLFGEAGNDTLNGDAGTDTVTGGLGTDTCDGETRISCERAGGTTTTTTTTTTTSTTAPGNCHPSYPTVCIPPPPPDLDCGDIPYRRFPTTGSDPHHFDSDHDGICCES